MERLKGIGGTDAAVIVGASPYKDVITLWEEKVGERLPDIQETPDTQRGKVMEEIAARMWALKYNIPIEKPKEGTLVHPEYDWIVGNPDYFAEPQDGSEPFLLEIKVPRSTTVRKIKREGARAYYYAQVQHYLMLTGMQKGVLVVLDVDNWDILEFEWERDEEFIKALFEKEKLFWWHVENKIRPTIADFVPVDVPDLKPDTAPITIEDKEWETLAQKYRELKEIEKQTSLMLSEVREELKRKMRELNASKATGGGITAYWTQRKSGRLDKDKLQVYLEQQGKSIEDFQKSDKEAYVFTIRLSGEE